ncbi:MAG: NrsF family protein [Bryobacteraceae bacterium]
MTEVVLGDLRPVSPLAGNATLTLIIISAIAAAMALLLAIVGAKGYPVMSTFQLVSFNVILTGMLLVTASSYVKRLVPGSLITIPVGPVLTIFGVLFACLVAWQFQRTYNLPMRKLDLACYECGLLGAGVTFIVAWTIGRRGFWSWNTATIRALSLLSAAAALFMLTIHCPLHNARHVLIGHGGAVFTVIGLGIAVSLLSKRAQNGHGHQAPRPKG